MRNLGKKRVTLICNTIAIVVHFFTCRALVLDAKMGVAGVAIANTSSAALNLVVHHIVVNRVFSSSLGQLFKWPNKITFNCDDCKKLLK
jgi:Na+-driven multidrug efflux pump